MQQAQTDSLESCPVLRSVQDISSPATQTQSQTEMSKVVDRFIDSVVQYLCIQIDIKVSKWRIIQALMEIQYQMGLGKYLLIFSGSFYEGMPDSVCGDSDIMITKRVYPSVTHQLHPATSEAQTPTGGGQVVMESNSNQPAYLRLTIPDDTASKTDLLKTLTKEYNNIMYLSSSMFVDYTLRGGAQVHGPAGVKVAVRENPEMGTLDRVHCLYSPTWPPCTQEFFLRPRSHGWPSDSLLHDIKQNGVHVVGASHQSTKERDLEWRWSFSVAEKELIHQLKPEIARAMYILKAIKKAVWSGDNFEGICSYYFKVACLWVAELRACTDVALDSVRNVLDLLVSCYQKRKLPHYFIREQNLIGHISKDTCNKVARKLRALKSELCLQVLCSVDMKSHVKHVINSIQRRVDIDEVDKPTREDFTLLIQTLFSGDNEKAVQALEEATHRVGPDSEEYAKEERSTLGVWSVASYTPMQHELKVQISTTSASELVTLPEKVLLPFIYNLSSIIIKPSHVDLFRSSLYRHLGEMYHYLYIYYKQHSKDLPPGVLQECYEKTETYYTTGVHMPHPNGWTDRGLSGLVNLAKFHYLNGEWDKMAGVMAKLQPLLEEVGQSPGMINGLSPMVIDKRLPLCKLPWGEDKLSYRQLVENSTGAFMFMNPAVLGYYIQGRLALRGDNKPLVEQSISRMQQALKDIWDLRQRKTVPIFIEVLVTYLLHYDDMKNAGFAKPTLGH